MTTERRERWPPDRFFWAVLDAPGWVRCGVLPAGLRAALADEVPVHEESLHAVCAPMGDGRVLVCAAREPDLNALDPEILALSPSSLPEFAPASVAQDELNLLTGRFEPRSIRRTRERKHQLIAATALAASALMCVGLIRRGRAWDVHAENARAASARILDAALPSGGDPGTEIDRLRSLHGVQSSRAGSIDAAVTLAAVLAGWPARVSCTTHSIAVGADGVSLSLTVEVDPSSFLTALRPPEGWALDEPRLNATENGTRVSLRLRPQDIGL